MLTLATRGGVSAQSVAAAIVRCQQINRLLGTNLGPWDLGGLPEEWLTALELWVDEMPRIKQWQAESAAALAKVRSRKVQ
jgi:hypothetical protein